MIATGTVREKQIELDYPLDMPAGTRVEVFVRPLSASTSHAIIGLFYEDAELLDTIVEEAMQARETRPCVQNMTRRYWITIFFFSVYLKGISSVKA